MRSRSIDVTGDEAVAVPAGLALGQLLACRRPTEAPSFGLRGLNLGGVVPA
jgi:hypothetical protein